MTDTFLHERTNFWIDLSSELTRWQAEVVAEPVIVGKIETAHGI